MFATDPIGIRMLQQQRFRAWKDVWVQPRRIQSHLPQSTRLEHDSGLGTETFSYHPSQRDTGQGVSRAIFNCAAPNVWESELDSAPKLGRMTT